MIKPYLIKIGMFEIRWYGLAYITGLLAGLYLAKRQLIKTLNFNLDEVFRLMNYLIFGILIGGRLFYVSVYDPIFYLNHPLEIPAIWHGGMAYHGGALGAVISIIWFCFRYKKKLWPILDLLGLYSTIGIGLGRLANFLNSELYGRVTTLPWGLVFTNSDGLIRHPSQLYEAFFEGAVLFILLYSIYHFAKPRAGTLFSLYLIFYGTFRFFLEFFREPDPQLGLYFNHLSMGQLLCLIMIGSGILIKFARRSP